MTEYEKLNEINKQIDFNVGDLGFRYYSNAFVEHQEVWYRAVDVREIIFSPEFMEKYLSYINVNTELQLNTSYDSLKFSTWLFSNLDDPVQYLYETLNPWNTNQ